jgi:hypothetical protein
VPTPDAPLVAAPVVAPRTSVTRSVTPAPDVVQRTRPRVVSPPVVSRTVPRVVAPTTTKTARAAAKPAPKPKPKPAPKARAKPNRHASPAKPPESPRYLGVPRDAVRLGLPAAALEAQTGIQTARPSENELNRELLVAAALLLAAAAGGSLLLGIAARNSARHA